MLPPFLARSVDGLGLGAKLNHLSVLAANHVPEPYGAIFCEPYSPICFLCTNHSGPPGCSHHATILHSSSRMSQMRWSQIVIRNRWPRDILSRSPSYSAGPSIIERSEERRVGKECRSRW